MQQRSKVKLPILYSFRRCPYAMRARLAMAIAEQTCELREIKLKARPKELFAASAKGTVPVLVLADGTVLEESLDIMKWALAQHDPQQWLPQGAEDAAETDELIAACDGDFKVHLDGTKYAARGESEERDRHRVLASEFLMTLDERLEATSCLMGESPGLADMALVPFVRQFAFIDPEWFAKQPWPHLSAWLDGFVGSALHERVMQKYLVWMPEFPGVLVDWRL